MGDTQAALLSTVYNCSVPFFLFRECQLRGLPLEKMPPFGILFHSFLDVQVVYFNLAWLVIK